VAGSRRPLLTSAGSRTSRSQASLAALRALWTERLPATALHADLAHRLRAIALAHAAESYNAAAWAAAHTDEAAGRALREDFEAARKARLAELRPPRASRLVNWGHPPELARKNAATTDSAWQKVPPGNRRNN
jgi:hypothetical protein